MLQAAGLSNGAMVIHIESSVQDNKNSLYALMPIASWKFSRCLLKGVVLPAVFSLNPIFLKQIAPCHTPQEKRSPPGGNSGIVCRRQSFCTPYPAFLPAYPTQPLACSAGGRLIPPYFSEIAANIDFRCSQNSLARIFNFLFLLLTTIQKRVGKNN